MHSSLDREDSEFLVNVKWRTFASIDKSMQNVTYIATVPQSEMDESANRVA